MTEQPEARPIGEILRDVVRGFALNQIHTAATEESRRRRITIAHAEGLITDEQAAEWLAVSEAAE